MIYTPNYLTLLEGVREVNFKIMVDYKNSEMVLTSLKTLKSLAELVHNLEREAGNTEDVKESEEFILEVRGDKQLLQFEIDMIIKSCDDLIAIYEDNTELTEAVVNKDLGHMLEMLGETTVVPVSMSGNTAHLVEHLNSNIIRFLKYTTGITANTLNQDSLKKSVLMSLTADISLEVTEVVRPEVNNKLKNVVEFEQRLEELGFWEAHKISDSIIIEGKSLADDLYAKLQDMPKGQLRKTSIF